MIKPEVVAADRQNVVIGRLVDHGFRVVRLLRRRFDRGSAADFYAAHRFKPFFDDLIDYITSGDVIGMELERDDAVAVLRAIAGATDPAKAAAGTLRAVLGTDIQRNVVHTSDSAESALRETELFFDRP